MTTPYRRARVIVDDEFVGHWFVALEPHSERLLKVLERHWRATVAVAIAVSFAVRLPLLFDGYGEDPDAWRVALAARTIHETGRYTVSRWPGNPVQELASSLLIPFGPVALNTATMALSLVAVLFFAWTARAAGSRLYAPLAMAFAFAPVVLEGSTEALDYMWALAALMVALFAAVRNRPVLAGCAVGIAIGCRVTSGAALIPLALLMSNRTSVLKMTALALVVGGVGFLPVLLTYGTEFWTFYERIVLYGDMGEVGRVPLAELIRSATVGVWGVIGCLGIGLALVATLLFGTRQRANPADRRLALACAAGVALWAIAYTRLPHKPAYLIPIIPFALLFADRYLREWITVLLCVCLTLAGLRALPAIRNTRAAGIERMQHVVATASMLPASAIVVAGYLTAKLEVVTPPDVFASRFTYAMTESEIADARARGVLLFYTIEGQESTDRLHGFDIASQTQPLLPGG